MPDVTVRGSCQAGRFVINQVARHIRDFLYDEGLEYEVDVDPGWPIGSIRISVTGPESKVNEAWDFIEQRTKIRRR
jgi:hypothetical protein